MIPRSTSVVRLGTLMMRHVPSPDGSSGAWEEYSYYYLNYFLFAQSLFHIPRILREERRAPLQSFLFSLVCVSECVALFLSSVWVRMCVWRGVIVCVEQP